MKVSTVEDLRVSGQHMAAHASDPRECATIDLTLFYSRTSRVVENHSRHHLRLSDTNSRDISFVTSVTTATRFTGCTCKGSQGRTGVGFLRSSGEGFSSNLGDVSQGIAGEGSRGSTYEIHQGSIGEGIRRAQVRVLDM